MPRIGQFAARETVGVWFDPAVYGNAHAFLPGSPWSARDPFGHEPEGPIIVTNKRTGKKTYIFTDPVNEEPITPPVPELPPPPCKPPRVTYQDKQDLVCSIIGDFLPQGGNTFTALCTKLPHVKFELPRHGPKY